MKRSSTDAAPIAEARRRGRPVKSETPAESARTLIVHAAAEEFARAGFDATSMRAVAREAGVDPALVRHYFSGKAELFSEAIATPMRAERLVLHALQGPRELVGDNLVRYIVTTLDAPGASGRVVRMMQTAMAEDFAATMFRQFLLREVLGRIVGELDTTDAELRASLAATQLLGLVMARYAIPVEPLAGASVDEVVARIGPVVQWHLVGDPASAAF